MLLIFDVYAKSSCTHFCVFILNNITKAPFLKFVLIMTVVLNAYFVVNYSNTTIAYCYSISNDILYGLTKSAIPDFTKKRTKMKELERRGWWCDL